MRRCADKSLARLGRKQATATKLGIYSTYSTRSSIHFLIRCSNFCKPLKKNIEGALQVEESPRINWATQFLTVAYDGACSPNVSVRMVWIFFWRYALQEKKTWWQLASGCCWNRTHHQTCFLSASVTRKDLQFGTWTDPSFQRHLEVGWAKDLPAPPHTVSLMAWTFHISSCQL